MEKEFYRYLVIPISINIFYISTQLFLKFIKASLVHAPNDPIFMHAQEYSLKLLIKIHSPSAKTSRWDVWGSRITLLIFLRFSQLYGSIFYFIYWIEYYSGIVQYLQLLSSQVHLGLISSSQGQTKQENLKPTSIRSRVFMLSFIPSASKT